MSDLTQQHCVPCEGNVPVMSKADAEAIISFVPGWALDDAGKKISCDLACKDFKEAMVFANKVAELAEHEGHHPDMAISYNKIHLELSTHAIGGLSNNDFVLAAKINELI